MKGWGRGKELKCWLSWKSLSTLLQLTALSRCSSESKRRGEGGMEGGRERGHNVSTYRQHDLQILVYVIARN